jgi:hypothetical protein
LRLDGHFGHHNALRLARQSHLQLISTLRGEAALYLPYTGPYAGRAPHRQDGRQRDSQKMPEKSLTETTGAGQNHPRVYQAQLLHKEFAPLLTVVLIVKTNLHTRAQAHALLFSRDLPLAYTSLVDY